MRFSSRTAWPSGINAWTEAVQQRRRSGLPLVDLTISNPTTCGLGPEAEVTLAPLRTPEALQYRPDPLGMIEARSAVVAYYRDHACEVAADHLCLTTSTSEAYSFLLRVLCDPGDEVLIARPSYPLFELLAGVEDVTLREYPLLYEAGVSPDETGAWSLDTAAMEANVTAQTRAIFVVHPNNPTGHYVSGHERAWLEAFCAARGLALVVDEVFLDYLHSQRGSAPESFASTRDCLCFVLSGLSKICALPQMKASWIVACGPEELTGEALRRLEIVADTFLSMNAPVQHALPSWLAERHTVQGRVRQRLIQNLSALDTRLEASLGDRLALEGGWTAVLRVPRFTEGTEFAYAALERGVLVQPGLLYGLPESRCVLSLLTPPELWAKGLQLLPL